MSVNMRLAQKYRSELEVSREKLQHLMNQVIDGISPKGGPRMAVVKSSDLVGKPWTAEYHLPAAQAEQLRELVRRSMSVEAGFDKLVKLATEDAFGIRLSDAVRRHLAEELGVC